MDNFPGTAGNDTFRADNTTMQAADIISGGAGTDTLEYTDARATAVADDVVPVPVVSGVENINIRNVNGTAAQTATREQVTLTLAAVTGTTTVASTITIDGTTVAIAAIGATATDVQVAKLVAEATYTNYNVTSYSGATVVLTAKTAGNVTNLATPTTVATSGTFAAPAMAIVNGVAAVTSTGANIVLDADNYAGATAFNSTNSLNTVTFNDLVASQALGIVGNGSVINGAVVAVYKATATSATLNVDGGAAAGAGTDVTITGNAVTSATINSTGAANAVDVVTLPSSTKSLTINATTNIAFGAGNSGSQEAVTGFAADATITVTGAGRVTLETLDADVDVINAAANTGGVVVVLDAEADTKFTGGSGNDTVTTGAVLTTGFASAGEGTGDRLIVASADHIASAAAVVAASAAKYTGFEVLRNNGATDLDATLVAGITSLEVGGADAGFTKMSAAQAANIRVLASNATNTFALADATGTTDVIGFTMQNETAAAVATAIDVGTLTVNGFETMNVVSASGTQLATSASGIANDLDFAGADRLTTLNISGTHDLDLAAGNITRAVTVNATNTGHFAASGSFTKGSVVNGNNTKNFFVVGGANANDGSTYNGGAGNDEFSTTAALLAADGTSDTVLNGGAGSRDRLTITSTNTLTDNEFTNVSGMELLALTDATAVSITGLGAAFKSAFASGVTVTSAALADGAAYTFGAGLYDKAVNVTVVGAADWDGVTANEDIRITTGSGDDTVSVTAADFSGIDGDIVIVTGAGNDSITLNLGTATTGVFDATTGVVSVNAGAGKDIVNIAAFVRTTGAADTMTVVVNAGHSTIDAYDSIIGFEKDGANYAHKLDFDSIALNTYSATAASGFTAAELTVAVSSVGLVTFAGTAATNATLAQKIAAVQSVVIVANGDAAVFEHLGNTYVFNNATAGDSLVELVGLTGVLGLQSSGNTTDYIYTV